MIAHARSYACTIAQRATETAVPFHWLLLQWRLTLSASVPGTVTVPTMYLQLWHAVCLMWQECRVQIVIDALCAGAAADTITSDMQASLTGLIEMYANLAAKIKHRRVAVCILSLIHI